jgi:oxygen-independent coproporphyrinogen-3 oxidase
MGISLSNFKNYTSNSKPEGLYIHIPFCIEKCPYCDFVSGIKPESSTVDKYFSALEKEFFLYLEIVDLSECKTLYFGGGTPSLFPKNLEKIVETIKKYAPKIEEISVEANPSSNLDPSDFSFATRISFGVQSFSEKNLKFLGRNHEPDDSKRVVSKFSNYFDVNVDIIFGIPEQTPQEHLEDLKISLDLGVKHISTYLLTPYENTPLGIKVKRGEIKLPEDVSGFFDIQGYLEDNGMMRYEISNFAFSGFFCKHNLLYWNRNDFLGLGISAWSKIRSARFANTPKITEYIEKISNKKFAVSHIDFIDTKRLIYEIIFLGLRKVNEGVDLKELSNYLDIEKFSDLISRKLGDFILVENGKLKIKRNFLYISDYITREIFLIVDKIFQPQQHSIPNLA